MLPIAFIGFGPAAMVSASGSVWLAVICLALLSTAFAYLLYFRLVSDAGATNASLVTLVVPVSAILAGHSFPRRTSGADRNSRHGSHCDGAGDNRRQALWQRYHRARLTDFATILQTRIKQYYQGLRIDLWKGYSYSAAMQHGFPLSVRQTRLDSALYSTHGGQTHGTYTANKRTDDMRIIRHYRRPDHGGISLIA